MVKYKISYRKNGLGEISKLILQFGGVEFIDDEITMEQWKTYKSSTPTGKLPILEVDGKQLPESGAINRYLAAKFGLRPKDDWENAQMESVIDFYRDFLIEISEWLQISSGIVEGDKEKLYKEIYVPFAEKTFKYLIGIISKSKSEFLADSGLSWGDFFIAESITKLQIFDCEFGQKFPEMVEYQKNVHENDKIKGFILKRKETEL